MRIVLDVTSAGRPNRTGMGRYSLELARGLSQILPDSDRLTLTAKPLRCRENSGLTELRSTTGLKLRTMPPVRADVFHTPGIVSRFGIAGRGIVTVPDTFTLDLPELSPGSWVQTRNQKLKRAVSKADFVIVFSSWVRSRFNLLFPEFPPGRVRVIAPGCDHLRSGSSCSEVEVLRRYGVGTRNYVLSVGRVEKRKNHERLVRAFAQGPAAKESDLLVVGPQGDADVRRVVDETGLQGRVRLLGRVRDDELGALYRGATAFALVSLYEGFGLPLLEAMAHGVPCLVSSGSALEEVAGGAALVADPFSVPDIACQLAAVLSDNGLRSRLSEQGRARSSEFTWRRCAAETLEVYREVMRLCRKPRKPRHSRGC